MTTRRRQSYTERQMVALRAKEATRADWRWRVAAKRFAATVPQDAAGDTLRRTLFCRARQLLDEGRAEAADELLALLPADRVRAFLDWYFTDELERSQ